MACKDKQPASRLTVKKGAYVGWVEVEGTVIPDVSAFEIGCIVEMALNKANSHPVKKSVVVADTDKFSEGSIIEEDISEEYLIPKNTQKDNNDQTS